jgi:hypothetical protein
VTCDWLHGNSIPNIGCHYFWPGLTALPKNTPTYLVGSLILKLEVAWVGSWFGLMYFCVVVTRLFLGHLPNITIFFQPFCLITHDRLISIKISIIDSSLNTFRKPKGFFFIKSRFCMTLLQTWRIFACLGYCFSPWNPNFMKSSFGFSSVKFVFLFLFCCVD